MNAAPTEALGKAAPAQGALPAYRWPRSRRRTLEIAVLAGGDVQVRAPVAMPIERIEVRLRARARWIARQRRTIERTAERPSPREFRSGESFRYLGASVPPARLPRGEAAHARTRRWSAQVTATPRRQICDRTRTGAMVPCSRAEQVLPARVAKVLELPAARG